MKDRSRIMYIRDANGHPCGCLAISIDRNKGRAEYALSVRHPVDAFDPNDGRKLNFDRKGAQLLTLRRLVEEPQRVAIDSEATQHDITESVMKAIAISDAPTRAVRFAKRWLRKVDAKFPALSIASYSPSV